MLCFAKTSASDSSHFIKMKAEERTEILDTNSARQEPVSFKYCLSFLKDRLTEFRLQLAEEFKMSKNTLISTKVVLFLQYIGITLLVYNILTNSWLVTGNVHCTGHAEKTLNETEGLIIASLCRNPNYRARFSGMFLLLEVFTMFLLLIKLAMAIKKFDIDFEDYLNLKLDSKTIFWILFIPRVLFYQFLPLQSVWATNLSSHFGSFFSVLRSPVLFFFGMSAKLITLPIALLFPYPLNDTAEIDILKFAKDLGKSEGLFGNVGPSDANVVLKCFENCRLSFEWSWIVSVSYMLMNFTVVYWFVEFSETIGEVTDEGRELDSRENFSDGVEFIRVSEVSEDFSFEEEENKVKNLDTTLKDFEGETTTVEQSIKEGEQVVVTGDVIDVATNESAAMTKTSVMSEGPINDEEMNEKAELEREEPEMEKVDEISTSKIEATENFQEIVKSNRGTQTFCLKLNKGCQTFVPIHLHKKVNKKTQVSPIFVDAQTNTDAVKVDVTSATRKEAAEIDHGRFKQNLVVEENGHDGVQEKRNGMMEDNDERMKKRENTDNESNKEFEKLVNGEGEVGVELVDSNVLVETNGSNGADKFGYSELTLIPRTFDFERRIIRENQIERINVDAFLKCLEKEDDSDVVFVEKDLLLETFRNIILTTKVSTTEDAVCPRSGDFVGECECKVHALIKKYTKQDGQQNDEVDGLKMETEDDDYSDDESFFNGFRL